MLSCFDNNCLKIHKKKLNICEFTKINLNLLNFLTPLCVCVCARARVLVHMYMGVCRTNIIVCILCNYKYNKYVYLVILIILSIIKI